MKTQKKFSTQKIKEINKHIFKLEKHFSDFKNSFLILRSIVIKMILNIDEDYYTPVRTKNAFNGNYIKYFIKEIKTKIYLLKNSFI